jgi:hypothetical protein
MSLYTNEAEQFRTAAASPTVKVFLAPSPTATKARSGTAIELSSNEMAGSSRVVILRLPTSRFGLAIFLDTTAGSKVYWIARKAVLTTDTVFTPTSGPNQRPKSVSFVQNSSLVSRLILKFNYLHRVEDNDGYDITGSMQQVRSGLQQSVVCTCGWENPGAEGDWPGVESW